MSYLSSAVDKIRHLLPNRFRSDRPVVAVVRLKGAIGMSQPLQQSLTFNAAVPALEKAFSMKGIRAVALAVNSPGGSPAQSHLIYQRIKALSAEKNIPVFAFVEDVAASGGYMIACAADEIFAGPTSIVGSIGVVSAGFGFNRFIERFGIERRGCTLPELPQEKIHVFFKDLVRSSRKEKLKGDEAFLFSGAFWVGLGALDLGLIDGYGDIRSILRKKFGD